MVGIAVDDIAFEPFGLFGDAKTKQIVGGAGNTADFLIWFSAV